MQFQKGKTDLAFPKIEGAKRMFGIQTTEILERDSPPYKHHTLEFMYDLSEEEFEQYLDMHRALRRFRFEAQLFTLLMWDVRDYYQVLENHRTFLSRHGPMSLRRGPLSLRLNRYYLSFLSSMRTFLDYVETRLKRRYGKNSSRFTAFKQRCSQAYDNNFAYRFLYRLRNYSQHCGLPINHIEFGVQAAEDDPDTPEYIFEIGIDRDHILEDFDWGSLESEVKAQPAMLDANALLDSMVKVLDELHTVEMAEELKALSNGALFIKGLMDRIPSDKGTPFIWEFTTTPDQKGLHFSQILEIPVDDVDAIVEGKLEHWACKYEK